MNAMITYRFKSETKKEYINFVGEKIEFKTLRKDIASRTGTKEEELLLYDQPTNAKLQDGEYIKAFSSIIIERTNPLVYMVTSSVVTPVIATDTNVAPGNTEHLDGILNTAKFFMIKSSNQINIQRAKDQNIWATTLINQRKLKMAFDEVPHVLLFFKASNSNNLYGVARMEEKPSDVSNKSAWIGVETIKLGGNFKIKWISKSIVAGSRYEHETNAITKEYVSRSADSTEIDRELGRKLIGLFDIPKDQEVSFIAASTQQKIFNIGDILKSTTGYPTSASMLPPIPVAHQLRMMMPPHLSNYPPYPYSMGPGRPHDLQSKPKKRRSVSSQDESSSSSSSSESRDSRRDRSRDKREKKSKRDRRDTRDRKDKRDRKRDRSSSMKKSKSSRHQKSHNKSTRHRR